MKLILNRFDKLPTCTIGKLTIEGTSFECYTLEDRIRTGKKVYGSTAIPAGKYQVVITFSPRFKTYMPLLLNVPNFKGIRIHTGNNEHHTEGCLLVGTGYKPGSKMITGSRIAYNRLLAILKKAEKKERIWIEIR